MAKPQPTPSPPALLAANAAAREAISTATLALADLQAYLNQINHTIKAHQPPTS